MIGFASSFLAVMLLLDPAEEIDAAAAAAVSEDADRVEVSGGRTTEVSSARVTSRSADFDRLEGVVMFEGDVVVRYADDYSMSADRLFMFLSKSNELSRVVAVGNVSITNATRVGTCAMATYRRKRSEIEMFGDAKALAHLAEMGQEASELDGTRIKFWLDSEQVEVDNSRIGVKTEKGVKAL